MMFFAFDRWFLEKFEKFSHRFQKLTGKDCFWLAKVCIGFGVLTSLWNSNLVWKYGHGNDKDILAIWIFGFIYGLMLVSYLPMIYSCEEEVKNNQMKNCANPMRLWCYPRFFIIWIPCCIMVPLTFFLLKEFVPSASGVLRIVGSTVFLWFIPTVYFLACDPLPSAKSKVRKWLKNAAEF